MATTHDRTQQPQRPRPRFRTVQVLRVEHLSPQMTRVTLGGDELQGFEVPAPTQHIKLILPEPGGDRPVLPDPSLPKGVGTPGQPRPLMRTYTIRRYDPGSAEMDVDFALHGDGPASTWARSAEPGAIVALAGPGGRPYQPRADAGWYLLLGDETALPAMGTLVEALPASMPVRVLAEVSNDAEHLELSGQARPEVSWLHHDAAGVTGDRLLPALRALSRPTGSGGVWVAAEAGIMRQLRRHLLDEWQLDAADVVTRGYWKAGEPNYRDGDYGED